MNNLASIVHLLVFPGGLFLIGTGLMYGWFNRKLIARFQNRIGPRWFQPFADTVKLMVKEDLVATGTPYNLFMALPVVALAGALTAGLYVPVFGLPAVTHFSGDLIVVLYLLSLMPFMLALTGLVVQSRFTRIGARRVMTQLFAYEVPFFVALLGPAFAAQSWQIDTIVTQQAGHWALFTQPVGFVVALISLMGKLEMPPFDAPEAETEIVAGALTEYTGRGLAVFKLARGVMMVISLTLIAALFMGGIHNPAGFLLKTLSLLVTITLLEVLITRLRIDQTVTIWWRYGLLLVFAQWLILIVPGVLR